LRGSHRGSPGNGRLAEAIGAARESAMLEVFYAGRPARSEIIAVKLEDLKLELGLSLGTWQRDKNGIVPLAFGAGMH